MHKVMAEVERAMGDFHLDLIQTLKAAYPALPQRGMCLSYRKYAAFSNVT